LATSFLQIHIRQRPGTKNEFKLPPDNGEPALQVSIQMLKGDSRSISFFEAVASRHWHQQ
jgi:hypothetical protein